MVDKNREKRIVAYIFIFPIILAVVAILIALNFSNKELTNYMAKDLSEILYDTHKTFVKNVVVSISESIKCRINDTDHNVRRVLISKIDEV